MAAIGEPLLVVSSLVRPGGNITGFSSFVTDLMRKRVELIKEMVPGLTRIAALFTMNNSSHLDQWSEVQAVAKLLGVESQLLDVRTPSEIVSSFDEAMRHQANALIVGIDTLIQANSQLIIELTIKHRLPTIFMSREFVEDGGLMTYGVHYPDLYRRAATLVHKIFTGALPADLPVEQPTKFEMVVNLRIARALELVLPPSILLRADEVIE
jgi:putative ABC transport system substrate-binding protein